MRGVNDWVVSASFQEGFLKGSVCTEEACESGGIPRTWAKEGAPSSPLGTGGTERSLERLKVGFDESRAHWHIHETRQWFAKSYSICLLQSSIRIETHQPASCGLSGARLQEVLIHRGWKWTYPWSWPIDTSLCFSSLLHPMCTAFCEALSLSVT